MNDEQIGRLSRKVADAPVPERIRLRLMQSRQAALAQWPRKTSPSGNVVAIVRRHPVLSLAGLVFFILMALTLLQQQQRQNETAIDLALLTSDVPMEALLDPTLLDRVQ